MPPRDDEVQALVEQLSAELDRSVLVDDASLRLLAYSPTLGSEDEVRRTAILTRETPRVIRDLHFAQGIATATQPVRTAPRPDIGLESRVCVPIRCQGALFGYLWLIDADQSLTDADCHAAERCAAEIGTAMYRRDELEKPQREHELRLLEQLLGADAAAARDGRARARRRTSCWSPAPAIGVLAVRRWRRRRTPSSARPSARGSASRSTSSAARCRAATRSARSHADHGVMLVDAVPSAAALGELARRAQEALDGRSRRPTRIVIGYSGQHEHLRDAHRAHEHARLALRVAGALPEHGTPAGWEGLGAYRLLARAAETPARARADPPRPAEAVRAAEQGVARPDARGLPRQRLRHQAHGRGAVPAPREPLLPAAAHRGDHRDHPQERRGPSRTAFRAQARPSGRAYIRR